MRILMAQGKALSDIREQYGSRTQRRKVLSGEPLHCQARYLISSMVHIRAFYIVLLQINTWKQYLDCTFFRLILPHSPRLLEGPQWKGERGFSKPLLPAWRIHLPSAPRTAYRPLFYSVPAHFH